MKLGHLLLLTDLSEEASVAYPFAAGLASALEVGRVTLLHVDDGQYGPFASYGEDEAFEAYTQRALSVRSRLVDDLHVMLEELGLDGRLRMEQGDPSKTILEFAHENRVDLIVMAKHGHGGLKMLLGSVSRQIARNQHIPVLLVDASSTRHHAPVAYGTVLAPTDFGRDSELGLDVSAELARDLGAKLKLITVSSKPDEVQTRLQIQAEAYGIAPEDALIEPGSRIPDALVAAALREDVDLISIPSHGKGAVVGVLLGSTTLQLVHTSKKPVLIWPPDFLRRRLFATGEHPTVG